ncbi:MAG: chemotaxis protein [Acidobacteria bacterium]|nr:MAG: chemotaxis protein [Acidobacteriota bacterium]
MNRIKKMSFTMKMFGTMIAIAAISLLAVTINLVRLINESLNAMALETVERSHRDMIIALETVDINLRNKLEEDLNLFEKEIMLRGGISIDNQSTVPTSVSHESSDEVSTVDLPVLKIGQVPLDDNELIDSISAQTGSSTTLFQLTDGKLIRVSTSVMNTDNQRATGSYIPSDSPVYQAISSGKPFVGNTFVLSKWYITAYKPLFNPSGKVIGAMYAGQPVISTQVKKLLSGDIVGDGYYFVYHNNGQLLLHPTFTSEVNTYELIPAFKNRTEDGWIEYDWKGQKKVSYKKYFKNWNVHLVLGVHIKKLIAAQEKKALVNSLYIGLLALCATIIAIFFLVRSISKPLKELAEKAEKVGKGDYTINFTSTSNDAIGQLTESLSRMVKKGNEMLNDIIISSKTLNSSSSKLISVARTMVESAEATTELADSADSDAREVADNMTAVSAAMEQSTSNIEMIAAAAEEMGTTISEIADNSSRARITTKEAVEGTKVSHQKVRKLGESADNIGSITQTITEISEQTNLLALNATIEAARAGEAGKGFAVVANEIKDLARQTAEATSQIKQTIDGIQTMTGETVENIESITKVINDVDEIVSGVVIAVEEQSITANEIVSNVSQASQGASDINQNIANSSVMTSRMTENVGAVKAKSLQVKQGVEDVEHAAYELSDLSTKLSALVEQFKLAENS